MPYRICLGNGVVLSDAQGYISGECAPNEFSTGSTAMNVFFFAKMKIFCKLINYSKISNVIQIYYVVICTNEHPKARLQFKLSCNSKIQILSYLLSTFDQFDKLPLDNSLAISLSCSLVRIYFRIVDVNLWQYWNVCEKVTS